MRTIYLDLDGVFANFNKGIAEVGAKRGLTSYEDTWKVLDQEDHFFLKLEPLPGAIDMFNLIYSSFPNVKMLTALPIITGNFVTAAEDKTKWVHSYLSPTIEVICSNGWADKKNYCKPDDVLIDDMQRNIDDWNKAGGYGITHTSNANTLIELAMVKFSDWSEPPY